MDDLSSFDSASALFDECRKMTDAVEALARGELTNAYKTLGTVSAFSAQLNPLNEAVDRTEALWRKTMLPAKKRISELSEKLQHQEEENRQMREQLASVTEKLATVMAEQLNKEKIMIMQLEAARAERDKARDEIAVVQQRMKAEVEAEVQRTRAAFEQVKEIRAALESEKKAKQRLELQLQKQEDVEQAHKQEMMKHIQEKARMLQQVETEQASKQVLKDQLESEREALFQLQDEYKRQRMLNTQQQAQLFEVHQQLSKAQAEIAKRDLTEKQRLEGRRTCIRCKKFYQITENTADSCAFHAGRLEQRCRDCKQWSSQDGAPPVCPESVQGGVCWFDRCRWTCCKSADKFSVGCATGKHMTSFTELQSPKSPSTP